MFPSRFIHSHNPNENHAVIRDCFYFSSRLSFIVQSSQAYKQILNKYEKRFFQKQFNNDAVFGFPALMVCIEFSIRKVNQPGIIFQSWVMELGMLVFIICIYINKALVLIIAYTLITVDIQQKMTCLSTTTQYVKTNFHSLITRLWVIPRQFGQKYDTFSLMPMQIRPYLKRFSSYMHSKVDRNLFFDIKV